MLSDPGPVGAGQRRNNDGLPEDWAEQLDGELHKDYWHELMSFVNAERRTHQVYPPRDRTFAAFELCRFADVRVVVIGQDPYHRPGQAHGLAFSVPTGVRKPPSLRKIDQELSADLGIDPPADGNLEAWARQGVLLLNTSLTVRAGEPGSHRGRWERFTDEVVRLVSARPERVVFLLWGADAQRKKKYVDLTRHAVVESAHPTARANALTPLLGSRPFSRTNELLAEARRPPIDWAARGR